MKWINWGLLMASVMLVLSMNSDICSAKMLPIDNDSGQAIDNDSGHSLLPAEAASPKIYAVGVLEVPQSSQVVRSTERYRLTGCSSCSSGTCRMASKSYVVPERSRRLSKTVSSSVHHVGYLCNGTSCSTRRATRLVLRR